MFTQDRQALLDEASIYALRKAELKAARDIRLARHIQKRKPKREDKAYWQGMIDSYRYTFNGIRYTLLQRGCIVPKPSTYINLLGE